MKKYIIKEDVLKGILEVGGLQGNVNKAGEVTVVKVMPEKVIIIGNYRESILGEWFG